MYPTDAYTTQLLLRPIRSWWQRPAVLIPFLVTMGLCGPYLAVVTFSHLAELFRQSGDADSGSIGTDDSPRWLVCIRNDTGGPIAFRFTSDAGSFNPDTQEAGTTKFYWGAGTQLNVAFDSSYDPGYQGAVLSLQPVIIHTSSPTNTEKGAARMYYFSRTTTPNEIWLFAQ